MSRKKYVNIYLTVHMILYQIAFKGVILVGCSNEFEGEGHRPLKATSYEAAGAAFSLAEAAILLVVLFCLERGREMADPREGGQPMKERGWTAGKKMLAIFEGL